MKPSAKLSAPAEAGGVGAGKPSPGGRPGTADDPSDGAPEAVAELEAVVAGAAEDDEPPEKRASEEPSNFLAMYFRDMARLAVLRPQEEFESARKIEALEIALWAHILSFPPLIDQVLQVCERTLENSVSEFKSLRKCAQAAQLARARKADQERLERAVLRTSEKLRA